MPGGVTITWLGHGSWQHVSPEGVRILVDPWFEGNPSAPEGIAPVADVILLTHGHFDHVADARSVQGRSDGAPVYAKFELATLLANRGIDPVIGFNTGGTATHEGLRFTMTVAHHSSSVTDADGHQHYAGEPAGYVITFENGYRIYQAGDTTVFGDMALIGELYRPDLAILPIGDFYTMGPYEAAKAVELLGVKEVIGGHWGTFEALSGTPQGLRDELAKRGVQGVTVHDLAPGASLAP